jgi:hypothetical protein
VADVMHNNSRAAYGRNMHKSGQAIKCFGEEMHQVTAFYRGLYRTKR